MKNIIDIIAEEVKQFDFLGNDERNKEQEINELLMNEELQKQFICDALLGRNDKVKIVEIQDSYLTGNWDEFNKEDADRLSLEYSLIIDYLYDSRKPPLRFNLFFNADKINISVGGCTTRVVGVAQWQMPLNPVGNHGMTVLIGVISM